MVKKVALILLLAGLLVLVGCEEGVTPPNEVIDQSWVLMSTSWEDAAGNSFSYMNNSGDDYLIDIHVISGSYNIICYIEEFNYENEQVIGTYTYFDPLDSEIERGPIDVAMTFSYASGALTITYTGPGTTYDILDGVTMTLDPSV